MAAETMRQQNLESSILFMQQEHAATLQGLHDEIQKLQKRCSDLTFQLAMETTSSPQEDFLRERVDYLEKEVKERTAMSHEKEEKLNKQDERIRLIEGKLKAQEMRFNTELKAKNSEIKHLKGEIENKSSTISALMTQIYAKKSKPERAYPKERSFEEEHVPTPPKEGAPTRRRSVGRSSNTILQNAVIPRAASGRRIPMKPDDPPEYVPDPAPFLHKKTGYKTVDATVAVSRKHAPHAPLPPIGRSSETEQLALAFRQTSLQETTASPLSSSPEVETLAVDQVGRDRDMRRTHGYNTSTDY